VDKNVVSFLSGDETMTLLAAEFLDLSMLQRIYQSPFRTEKQKAR